MRILACIGLVALAMGTTGCGNKTEVAKPAELTPEQIKAAMAEQKEADNAERAQHKSDPTYKKGSGDASVEEEGNRARRR